MLNRLFIGIYLGLLVLAAPVQSSAQSLQTIVLDGSAIGPEFGGIYDALPSFAQSKNFDSRSSVVREQMLDYLFRSQFGASLHTPQVTAFTGSTNEDSMSQKFPVNLLGLDDVTDPFLREITVVASFNNNYLSTGTVTYILRDIALPVGDSGTYPDVQIIALDPSAPTGYDVQPIIWGFAHIDQFVRPGWKFVNSGGCGHLTAGGSYTTLVAPNGRDYSVIAETKGATSVQRITFKSVHGFPGPKSIYVWRSMPNDQFDKDQEMSTNGRGFSVDLQPNTIYSITSTLGENKGSF
jgi:hypothetical protein